MAIKPKKFLSSLEKLFLSAIIDITFLLSSFDTVGFKIISLKSEFSFNNLSKLLIPSSALSNSEFSIESS